MPLIQYRTKSGAEYMNPLQWLQDIHAGSYAKVPQPLARDRLMPEFGQLYCNSKFNIIHQLG